MNRTSGALALLLLMSSLAFAQPFAGTAPVSINTADLNVEVKEFLARELAAHLSAIESLDPPPDRIYGAGTTGEFSWGTFMRAVAAYAELTGERSLAGRDLACEVAQIGLLEYRLKSTRFSQLYAVLALRHFGHDLKSNRVWQSLSDEEQTAWRKLLDISAFYDPKTQQVINLPENYLGVAARIASLSFQVGLLKDRALLDGVLTRAARPFENGGIYSDDAPETGRFDRYSNEHARYVWFAAEAAGRKDILDLLRPSLKTQMRLWWDLVLPDGYGYAWGRSLGVVSYLDTLEIVGFLGQHPEFRPASLEKLASAYYQAWNWLRRDYNETRHVLSVFAFGRGNYAYISPSREWQQTTGFFGKTALAHAMFTEALEREKVVKIPTTIPRSDVHRFEFFRRGERQAGVWLVRQGPLYFTLPITTGTRPGVADYLPAPHGLSGFAAPVEQVYPSLVPFIELADGRVLVAGDGADEIEPAADGRSLRVIWRRWALVGGRSAQPVAVPLTSEVQFRIEGASLIRDETLKATEPITLRRWWVAVPTSAAEHRVEIVSGLRRDWFKANDSGLEVSAAADWPLKVSLMATGDSVLGRGARGAAPLHLIYETRDLSFTAQGARRWRLILRVQGEE